MLRKEFVPRLNVIRNQEGTMLQTKDDIKRRWTQYCSSLYKDPGGGDGMIKELVDIAPPEDEVPQEILYSEVQTAINSLKRNKSPGSDGITAEMLQAGGEPLSRQIHKLCNKAWHEVTIPEEWGKSILVPIPKKGDLSSKQQCLNELDLVRRLRDNKENLNSNANLGASITTVSSAVSTQGKISIANSDRIILETTVSDSVADIIPIQADILNSSSTVSSRTKQMSSCGLQILNHSLNTISVESSAQPSGAPRILTPSSAATPKAKVGSNLQNFHTDPLTDLADRLTEIVEDIIPTDDNVCEWICTLYDTIQRQTNLEVAFDQEALKLDIPSVVLKTCVNLSKPPTSTALKLFQQICHQELAGYKSSSDIPSIKMDAIH
ncbi:unnamed protein product, partial [Rotaria magnacalcarata]